LADMSTKAEGEGRGDDVEGDPDEQVAQGEEEEGEGEGADREHTVKDRETLNSIAAFYDTTPTALAQFNKMGTSKFIFPGKVLRIPPKEKPKPPPPSPRKPERHVVVAEEEIVERQFVKINVRHITDGRGVVFGSLLVTPKTAMFNPNLTDLLVMETEQPDGYQIVAPSDLVVNYAIFNDFYKFNSSFGIDVKEEDKGTLYVPKETPEEDDKEGGDEMDDEGSWRSRQGSLEPMYLRMVMGKPINKKLPRHAPIMSYGSQTLEPEYWFIVPPDKVDALASVLAHLFPEKYGLLDHMAIERSGHEVIRPGTTLLEEDAGKSVNRESVSKLLHKTFTMGSVDFDLVSEMRGESEIILADDRRAVARHLPPRTDGHSWELYYGTGRDGYSLHHLYNRLQRYDGPCLLAIKDLTGSTFGAYLTSPPRESKSMEGTGETFVFSLRPDFAAYKWTGENEYFFKGNADSFVVGSGNGKFGIWIDADLNQGRTQTCPTFDNDPLTREGDFTIQALECWAFTD